MSGPTSASAQGRVAALGGTLENVANFGSHQRRHRLMTVPEV